MNIDRHRFGLYLFGLLSVADGAAALLGDGKHPPVAIVISGAVLGATSLVLVVRCLRDPSRSIRLLVGLRVLSAVTALPAFIVGDVPTTAVVAAATVVALTAVGVALVGAGGSRLTVSS